MKPFAKRPLLLAVVALLLAAAAAIQFILNDAPRDSNYEKLSVILPQYQSQLTRCEHLMRAIRGRANNQLSAARTAAAHFNSRMNVLRFQLDVTPDNSVLVISLAAMQIIEMKHQLNEYHVILGGLADFYRNSRREITQIDSFLGGLTTESLSPEDSERITECRRAIATMLPELNAGIAALAPLEEIVNQLNVKLTKLEDYGELRRSKSFQLCFFSRGSGFVTMSAFGILPTQFWLDNLPGIWRMIEPQNLYGFLLRLAGLLAAVTIPLFLICKFLIFPPLIRHIPTGEFYVSSRVLPVGTSLIGAGAACLLATLIAGAGMGPLLRDGGHFLIYLGCLMLALAFRMGRTEWGRCMWLYGPGLFVTLVAKWMYSFLIPYGALVQLLPFLGLLGAIWTAAILLRKRCPMLDTVLGIISVPVYLGAGASAWWGMPYVGFTVMLMYFSLMVQFLTVLALTETTLRVIRSTPERKHRNNLLGSLVIPGYWMFLVGNFFMNLISTYHLADWEELLAKNFPIPPAICTFHVMDLAGIAIGFFIMRFLVNFGRLLVQEIYRDRADEGTIPSFVTLGGYVAWAFFILFILVMLHVNPSSILVVLGGFSMGVGFAMKEVLENFVAGIILLLGQHVRPGDIIEFDSIMGTVKRINFRATVIAGWDGSVITLPNTRVIGKDFRNWTRNDRLMRRDIAVGVGYDSDLDLVRRVLLEQAALVPGVMKYPEPIVCCTEFGESSVNFIVRLWMPALNYVDISSDYRERIFAEFKRQNISIPFNQLDLHLIPPVPPITVAPPSPQAD